ncbi:hypothetical protein FB451DRAFT_1185574 [Mycena latifolia]|nr:hypothetical protein FB451DRAFT_1185574 [Mycena latifolia]
MLQWEAPSLIAVLQKFEAKGKEDRISTTSPILVRGFERQPARSQSRRCNIVSIGRYPGGGTPALESYRPWWWRSSSSSTIAPLSAEFPMSSLLWNVKDCNIPGQTGTRRIQDILCSGGRWLPGMCCQEDLTQMPAETLEDKVHGVMYGLPAVAGAGGHVDYVLGRHRALLENHTGFNTTCLLPPIMQTTYQPTSFSSLAMEIRSDIWTRLPRQSKACILSVCQEWKVQALGTPYLWTELVFGETSTPNDLLIARRWIADSQKLQLTVTISQRPSATGSEQLTLPSIFEALSPVAERIKSLDISGPDSNANAVQSFMMQGTFPVLGSLAVMLQTHWLRTIRDGPTALSTLVHRPDVFYTLQLPVLSSLHLANIPAFWPASPASGTRLTEVVLGPQIREFCPTFPELHNVLRSTITLTHLGFYREIPGLDINHFRAPSKLLIPATFRPPLGLGQIGLRGLRIQEQVFVKQVAGSKKKCSTYLGGSSARIT